MYFLLWLYHMIFGFGWFALGRFSSDVALTCYTCSYRYTSSVRYDSDRHFIQDVTLQPKGLGLEMCSQTVLALPQSTWRHYKTQLEFQPRQRVQRYQSTTIVYPKHTRTFYTTQLNYDGHKLTKRFFSAVELQASDCQAGLWKTRRHLCLTLHPHMHQL